MLVPAWIVLWLFLIGGTGIIIQGALDGFRGNAPLEGKRKRQVLGVLAGVLMIVLGIIILCYQE
jgi:hypothetical protein